MRRAGFRYRVSRQGAARRSRAGSRASGNDRQQETGGSRGVMKLLRTLATLALLTGIAAVQTGCLSCVVIDERFNPVKRTTQQVSKLVIVGHSPGGDSVTVRSGRNRMHSSYLIPEDYDNTRALSGILGAIGGSADKSSACKMTLELGCDGNFLKCPAGTVALRNWYPPTRDAPFLMVTQVPVTYTYCSIPLTAASMTMDIVLLGCALVADAVTSPLQLGFECALGDWRSIK